MTSILVYVEHHEGTFIPSSLGVLSKAREIASQAGGSVSAVLAGSGVADAATSLGAYGASTVYVADDARYANPTAEPLVDVVAAAIEQARPSVVLASASVLAAEVAGGIAARFGVGINTDGVDVRADGDDVVVQRPALDDSVYVDCGFTRAHDGTGLRGVALFRANSFAPESPNGGQATVEQLTVDGSGRPSGEFVGRTQPETGGVDITKADILVGAGRGLQGPDNFALVESLAKALGGEVATTRAVVDAGWYDYSTQVGQTGKTVAPKLYLAVGISGAIQHKVGMQNSDTIVAINKDPNAPIFEFADLGVIGDLFEIVPKLEAAIRERKGS